MSGKGGYFWLVTRGARDADTEGRRTFRGTLVEPSSSSPRSKSVSYCSLTQDPSALPCEKHRGTVPMFRAKQLRKLSTIFYRKYYFCPALRGASSLPRVIRGNGSIRLGEGG